MKCFAWIESAVQALSNDGKGGHRKDDHKGTSQEEPKGDEIKVSQAEVPPPTIASLPSIQAIENPSQSTSIDIWNDPPIAQEAAMVIDALTKRSTIRPISSENLPVTTSSKTAGKPMSNAKEPLYDASLGFDYNPAVVAYVSSGRVTNGRTLRRRNMSSTSTIFKNSPLAPITIIVTTPEEHSPSPPSTALPAKEPHNPFNAIRAHRQSASLPSSRRQSLTSPNPQLLIPDSNRLKPPTEQQINSNKLKKAREFREVRKFLINFMNAKGDQFPKKLRIRMMEMYCITEADLSPETVAKFDADTKDEGVALEQLGISEQEGTDLDDLKILQMAFMSQIPVVTPTREQAAVDTIPSPRPRKQSLIGRRAEARGKEEEAPLSWLGPLITSTPLLAPPLDSPPPKPFTGEHKLIRASSVPNLQRLAELDVPPVPAIPAAFSQVTRGRNSTLSEGSTPVDEKLRIIDQQTRIKRGNIISGAFGSIRSAMAANKMAREKEKRRLLKDAIL